MSIIFGLLLNVMLSLVVSNSDFLKHSDPMPISNGIQAIEEIINIKCFFVNKFDVYNFESLHKEKEDHIYAIDEQSSLKYNFCQNTYEQCPSGNSTLIRQDNNGNCVRFSGSIDGEKNSMKYNEWTTYEEGLNQGINLKLVPGDSCQSDPSKNYQVTYKIECLNEGQDDDIELDFSPLIQQNKCEYTILGRAKVACPFLNYYIINAFFSQNSSYLGIILILVGTFLAFLGGKFIRVTVVLVTSFAGALLAILLVFNFITITDYKYVWITLGVGFLIGFILGFILIKAFKIFLFILGGTCGYTVGVFLSTFILQWVSWNPEILYWIIICVFIITFGILALWLVKHALIVATSVIGAYMVARGISLYAGGFPNESEIIDLIKKEEWDLLDQYRTPYVYAYLAGIVLIAGLGIFGQERMNKDKGNDHYTKI